jgi:hypothetical protein
MVSRFVLTVVVMDSMDACACVLMLFKEAVIELWMLFMLVVVC